ncbi:MAG: hypothetical protein ACLSE4_08215 [Clostridium sp.]
MKGRIRLGTILLLAFRMLLDKNIRLWIRAARGRKEKPKLYDMAGIVRPRMIWPSA